MIVKLNVLATDYDHSTFFNVINNSFSFKQKIWYLSKLEYFQRMLTGYDFKILILNCR